MEIPHDSNLNSCNQLHLIEMVKQLNVELKMLKHNKNYDLEVIKHRIEYLESVNRELVAKNVKLKNDFKTLSTHLFKKLTIKERILGKFIPSDSIAK